MSKSFPDSKFRRNRRKCSDFKVKKTEDSFILDNIKEVQNKMDSLCGLVENSIKNGKEREEALNVLISPGFRYYTLVKKYIDYYKRVKTYEMYSENKSPYRRIIFGELAKSPISDEQALSQIYDDYIKRKENINSKGDIDEPQ